MSLSCSLTNHLFSVTIPQFSLFLNFHYFCMSDIFINFYFHFLNWIIFSDWIFIPILNFGYFYGLFCTSFKFKWTFFFQFLRDIFPFSNWNFIFYYILCYLSILFYIFPFFFILFMLSFTILLTVYYRWYNRADQFLTYDRQMLIWFLVI